MAQNIIKLSQYCLNECFCYNWGHENIKQQNRLQQSKVLIINDYNLIICYKMPTTCLICCEQAEYFLLPPCNHKQMCWKCCVTLIQGSTFSCPYCKGTPQGTACILFVNEQQMNNYTFQDIFRRSPFKSAVKSYQFYSNQQVAHFIQQSTSTFCRFCSQQYSNINVLKKHLNEVHRRQFCDVCLENKKCLISQQSLYTEGQLTVHFKKGECSSEGQVILYHPWCDFCKQRFYDIDTFRVHLRTSTHLKCHICQQNYPKLKYVYYKDFNQIQRHFQKSHFVCEIGTCITRKLQNVYVSQEMLQQHKNRAHNKNSGSKAKKQVLNIILFSQNKQEQFQWDKIGRDFTKEFMIAQKSEQMKNEEHHNGIIDIRQFYPQLTKHNNKMNLDQVLNKLQNYLFKADYKSDVVHFGSVSLFCPLHMSSLTRVQLQAFIRNIYEPKYSEPIIQTFFTKKFQFRSQNQYFLDVKRRMWSFSPISYYYVFPQLIRFFKDTNPTKANMDEYYAQSLRDLHINKFFVFHNKQRYSDILHMLQQQIQNFIYQQMIQQKIDLNLYCKYLKDLNPQFYHENHSKLFYVQKQKIKNMYHMVQKTKTNQLLKLGWLLKLGFSNASYKTIYDKFYYKTIQECGQAVKNISLQQLALLYAYIEICLQALIDKALFTANKAHSPTLFLGTILSKIKTCIGNKQLTLLRSIQAKSVEMAAQLNSYNLSVQGKKRNAIVDEQEHPSLLAVDYLTKNNSNQNNYTAFGINWQTTTTSNSANNKIKINKKNNKVIQNQQKQQDFPELFKNKKNVKPSEKQQQSQDFPVYNYQQRSTGSEFQNKKKQEKKKKIQEEQYSSNIEKLDLFNPKNALLSQRKTQIYYKNLENQQNKKQNPDDKWKSFQDSWPTLDQKYKQDSPNEPKSKKKKKKKQIQEKQHNTINFEEIKNSQTSPQIIFKKKTKQQLKAQQQNETKKNKNSKKNKIGQTKLINQQKQFQKQKQQQVVQIKKKKVRLDVSGSSSQQERRKQIKKKQRQQKRKKFEQEEKIKQQIKYHEGFDSLFDKNSNNQQNNNSIINNIIESSKKVESKPQIIIKKGKKGKVVVERVDLSQLRNM